MLSFGKFRLLYRSEKATPVSTVWLGREMLCSALACSGSSIAQRAFVVRLASLSSSGQTPGAALLSLNIFMPVHRSAIACCTIGKLSLGAICFGRCFARIWNVLADQTYGDGLPDSLRWSGKPSLHASSVKRWFDQLRSVRAGGLLEGTMVESSVPKLPLET